MKKLLKHFWYKYFGKRPKEFIMGRLGRVMPNKYKARVREKLLLGSREFSFFEHAACYAVLDDYFRLPESERKAFNEIYWGGEVGTHWNESKRQYSYSGFAESREDFINKILLVCARINCDFLIEIGTGNGELLISLAEKLSTSIPTVGLDLSSRTIAANQKRYSAIHPQVSFLKADAMDYILNVECKSPLFLACGTFEYFSEPELCAFLSMITGKFATSGLAVKDTINFDVGVNTSSKPRGSIAFSHNYEHLLALFGFEIQSVAYTPLAGEPFYQDVELIAVKSTHAGALRCEERH